MTDNNVVSLFGKEGEKNNGTEISNTQEEVLGLVDETLEGEDVELPIDSSFTIENIIGALVSNKFYNAESYIKEGLVSNTNHDYTESITVLYEYILTSLNGILKRKGRVAEWGGSTLSSMLIKEEGSDVILLEIVIELWLMNDMSTGIVFFEEGQEIYAILKNEITEVG